jgi:hypothetical protein
MLLGLEGPGVFFAYVGSILATLLCVVYGALNWNPKEDEQKEIEEELAWEAKEAENGGKS